MESVNFILFTGDYVPVTQNAVTVAHNTSIAVPVPVNRETASTYRPSSPRHLRSPAKTAILSALQMGCHLEQACAFAKVDPSVVKGWIQKGERARSGEYYEFVQALKESESTGEVQLVKVIYEAASMKQEWKAAESLLKRRYPDRWGDKNQVNITFDQVNKAIDLIARIIDKYVTNPDTREKIAYELSRLDGQVFGELDSAES